MITRVISDINRRTGKPGWLQKESALSYERAKAAGAPGKRINDAGRTRAEQQRLYDAWLRTGKRNPPSVARPGTSLHEKGNAIDLAEPARAWFHKYGKYYGWINPAWAKRSNTYEPWHFEHDPKKDRSKHVKIKVTRTMTGATYWAICRATGRPAITKPGPNGQKSFWKYVQRTINRTMKGTKGWVPLVRDGIPGPKTSRGLQESLRKVNRIHRPKVDGDIGPHTIECWQRALRAGKWGRTKKQINQGSE